VATEAAGHSYTRRSGQGPIRYLTSLESRAALGLQWISIGETPCKSRLDGVSGIIPSVHLLACPAFPPLAPLGPHERRSAIPCPLNWARRGSSTGRRPEHDPSYSTRVGGTHSSLSLGACFSNQPLTTGGQLTGTVKPGCGATKCRGFAFILPATRTQSRGGTARRRIPTPSGSRAWFRRRAFNVRSIWSNRTRGAALPAEGTTGALPTQLLSAFRIAAHTGDQPAVGRPGTPQRSRAGLWEPTWTR